MRSRATCPRPSRLLELVCVILVAAAEATSGEVSSERTGRARAIVERGGYQRDLPRVERGDSQEPRGPGGESGEDNGGDSSENGEGDGDGDGNSGTTGGQSGGTPGEYPRGRGRRIRPGEGLPGRGSSSPSGSACGGIDFSGLGGIGQIFTVLAYVLGIVIVALVIWWIVTHFANRDARDAAGGHADVRALALSPDEKKRLEGLPDPNALAEAGDWPGAIHALLLHAIRHLETRQARPVVESATSRELLATFALDARAQPAFRHLVRAVEACLFAGRRAARQDYVRSLEHYQTITAGGTP